MSDIRKSMILIHRYRLHIRRTVRQHNTSRNLFRKYIYHIELYCNRISRRRHFRQIIGYQQTGITCKGSHRHWFATDSYFCFHLTGGRINLPEFVVEPLRNPKRFRQRIIQNIRRSSSAFCFGLYGKFLSIQFVHGTVVSVTYHPEFTIRILRHGIDRGRERDFLFHFLSVGRHLDEFTACPVCYKQGFPVVCQKQTVR